MKKTIITAWTLSAVCFTLQMIAGFSKFNFLNWTYSYQAEQIVMTISLIAAFILSAMDYLLELEKNDLLNSKGKE